MILEDEVIAILAFLDSILSIMDAGFVSTNYNTLSSFSIICRRRFLHLVAFTAD